MRTIEHGDEEVVEKKKKEAANMTLARFYEPLHEQQKRAKEFVDIVKEDIEEELRKQDAHDRAKELEGYANQKEYVEAQMKEKLDKPVVEQ